MRWRRLSDVVPSRSLGKFNKSSTDFWFTIPRSGVNGAVSLGHSLPQLCCWVHHKETGCNGALLKEHNSRDLDSGKGSTFRSVKCTFHYYSMGYILEPGVNVWLLAGLCLLIEIRHVQIVQTAQRIGWDRLWFCSGEWVCFHMVNMPWSLLHDIIALVVIAPFMWSW